MEIEIPLPPLASDPSKPDLSIVQRAWWDVIKLVYREAENERSPMRLVLELRIMGGSDMLMAPQYKNDLGTASIEILTVPNAVPEQWEAFKQEVADIWMSYEHEGVKLNSRPHWAKEWYANQFFFWLARRKSLLNYFRESLKKDGVPIRKYLKETAFKDQIPLFKAQLEDLGNKQGWTLHDIQSRFSNELWDEMIFS